MRRSLSPMVQKELENLDKDSASRKLAMKALKSYVKELDSKTIPHFLAQVSERKESTSSGEHTISLYEVLARVHGSKIVPQIGNIMSTITKTLSSSAGSFALHQACSKVVPAIARYGIEPTTPDDKKRGILGSLCKPLSDCLLGNQESLSSGAALCLKALVDCDNWRYASNEMVNEVCQRVAGALEKHMQSNSHLALVMSLAKHNNFVVEAYARLLIHTGIQVLNTGAAEGNLQKRLTAIHMVNTLMRCLDHQSILSEVGLIIEEMEKFQGDKIAYVSGAAFEALQTAKRICIEKSPKYESDSSSLRGNCRRNILSSGSHSPQSASPESQTIDSFLLCDSFVDSPGSINQSPKGSGQNHRSGNRKLWARPKNGVVDVSLKDGILSEAIHAIASQNNDNDEYSSQCGDNADDFSGFSVGDTTNENSRSTTPSPQRSHINFDNVKIFTTPRKLIHSLQEVDDINSENNENKNIRYCKSPSSKKLERGTTAFKNERRCYCYRQTIQVEGDEKSPAIDDQFQTRTESASSTENFINDHDQHALSELKRGSVIVPEIVTVVGKRGKEMKLICGIFMILLAVSVFLFCIEDEKANYSLVPT